MNQEKVIENTVQFVKKELEHAEGGHDWFHIERVYKNALLISKEEKVFYSGTTTERLDVSNFQNGVYFINLQVGNKITTQKLVITK